MKLRFILPLIAGLLLTACKPTATDNGKAALEEYFSSVFPADEPGGAVLIMSGDSVVFSGAWGLADLKTREPVTTKTLFNLGSVSKTFVANGILRLHDEGKLSLNDSLIKYFPDFSNPAIGRQVKIRHLLTHTSGLPDIRFPYEDSVFYLAAKDAENWVPILKAEKLNFEPGSRYEYSNPAFNGLALIIEQVSGTKWQDYLTKTIIRPAGMNNTTITDGAHPSTGVAHAYIFSRGEWLEKDYMEEPTFAASGNGGVWSSVEELAKYEQAIRNSVFLKVETIAESRTIQRPVNWKDSTDARIGWSWFIGKTANGLPTVGHTGSQGGFRANYQAVPEKKWLVVMLSGSPRPLEEYTARAFEFLNGK